MFLSEKINLNIIKYCIYTVIATPLVYSSYFLYPTIFPKNIFFRIAVTGAILFYLLLVVKNRKYLPKISLITICFFAFLSLCFLSSAINPGWSLSFFDSFERMEGLINYIYLFAFLIILISTIKNKDEWLKFFKWSLFINLLVSIYAILQKLNLDFVINTGIDRVNSTLGNSSFLASYLLFGIFLGFYVIKYAKDYKEKIIYSLVILLNIIIIFLTETRGVLLALIIGFIIWGLIMIVRKKGYQRIILSVILFLLFLSFALIPIYQQEKVKTIWQEASIQNRLVVWQISWEAIKENPVFGWGAGNFDVALNEHYEPLLAETFFDHAHNIIFDIGVKFGLIGLLAYLSIFISSFFILWQSYKRNKIDFNEWLTFNILIIVYFVQNLFLFDSINSFMMLILILGYITFLDGQQIDLPNIKKKYLIFTILIISLASVYSLIFYNIKPTLANYYTNQALKNQNEDPYDTVKYFKKSIDLNSFGQMDIGKRVAQVAVQNVNNQKFNLMNKKEIIELAEKTNQDLHVSYPNKLRPILNLAMIYLSAGELVDNRLSKAEDILTYGINLAPKKFEINDLLVIFYIQKQDWQKALEQVDIILTLNSGYQEAYFKKGVLNILLNNIEVGEQSLQEANNLGKDYTFIDFIDIASSYERGGYFEQAIKNYEASLKTSEERPLEGVNYVYNKLFQLYKEVGDIDNMKRIEIKL